MSSLPDLHRAVRTALASKKLGTPVFVRYVVQRQSDALPPAYLAGYVTLAREWIGQPLERIYAASGDAKHVCLSLEFQKGATAMLAFSSTPGRGDGADLLVVGNHGAIYHDAGDAQLWDEALAEDKRDADPALAAWIERALQSSRPETEKGGER
jgi:hypothetical protein